MRSIRKDKHSLLSIYIRLLIPAYLYKHTHTHILFPHSLSLPRCLPSNLFSFKRDDLIMFTLLGYLTYSAVWLTACLPVWLTASLLVCLAPCLPIYLILPSYQLFGLLVCVFACLTASATYLTTLLLRLTDRHGHRRAHTKPTHMPHISHTFLIIDYKCGHL